jgi:hypothetical protein
MAVEGTRSRLRRPDRPSSNIPWPVKCTGMDSSRSLQAADDRSTCSSNQKQRQEEHEGGHNGPSCTLVMPFHLSRRVRPCHPPPPPLPLWEATISELLRPRRCSAVTNNKPQMKT